MDEAALNMSVRRFLKQLGVTAQRDIELAVREQLDAGELRGDERLEATATVGGPRTAPRRRRDRNDRALLSCPHADGRQSGGAPPATPAVMVAQLSGRESSTPAVAWRAANELPVGGGAPSTVSVGSCREDPLRDEVALGR